MQAPADFSGKRLPSGGLQRPLILVGASVRAAAQSASQAGFSVIGIDLFGDTDTLEACAEHHQLRGISDLDDFCLSLPPTDVMQVGGLRDELPVMDCLANQHHLLGPATKLREKLRDPNFLSQLAEQCGLQFPATARAMPPCVDRYGKQAIDSIHGSRETLRRLEKNPSDSGGLGVRWSQDRHQTRLSVHRETGSTGDHRQDGKYLQQWVAGRNYGASFLGDGVSTHLLGVCRSSSTRKHGLPFVYAGSMGPICLADSTHVSLVKLGCALTRLGLRGLFNADVIVDRSGAIWLLEINPRWSGSSEVLERSMRDRGQLSQANSLLGLAHQASSEPPGSLKNWIAASESAASNFPPRVISIKRIVYSRNDMRFDPNSLRRAISALQDDRLRIELCDLPPPGSLIGSGEPILSLIASFPQRKDKQRDGTGVLLRKYIAAVQRSGISSRGSRHDAELAGSLADPGWPSSR